MTVEQYIGFQSSKSRMVQSSICSFEKLSVTRSDLFQEWHNFDMPVNKQNTKEDIKGFMACQSVDELREYFRKLRNARIQRTIKETPTFRNYPTRTSRPKDTK